ncbi:MAG: helix-turn-helix transcriptional regulator [Devosia sp.]
MCRFDPAAVARIIPEGLTPSGTGWGIICFYDAPQGWGIAPFGAMYMTAELAGLEAPDTSPGNYMHSGFFTGVAGEVMTRSYNTNFHIGWSRLLISDGVAIGEAGIGDKTLVRARARIGGTLDPISGASRYIGKRPGGGFTSYTVAVSLGVKETHDQSVEYFEGASEWLHCLEPLEYAYPVLFEGEITITSPTTLGEGEDKENQRREADLAAIFNRLGRAAVILAKDGSVVGTNAKADGLIAEGRVKIAGGRIAFSKSRDTEAFDELLRGAAGRSPDAVTARVALRSGVGELPLLAQAIVLDANPAGHERLLVTLDDPARAVDSDPVPALQLLGLTPAEARIAGLVGGGHSPREAAETLNLSLYTIRSALKIAFDKFGISRQSELAKIVARLAG